MKQTLSSVFLTIILSLVITGCNNNEDVNLSKAGNDIVDVKSSINKAESVTMIKSIGAIVESKTRSDGALTLDDEEAREMMEPYVADGQEIQTTIIEQLEEQCPDDAELIAAYEELSEEELAVMSYIISLTTPGDGETQDVSEYKVGQVMSCISAGLGFVDLSDTWEGITMKGITAVSARQLLPFVKFIGKHYLGWVSVALFAWDVYCCLEG